MCLIIIQPMRKITALIILILPNLSQGGDSLSWSAVQAQFKDVVTSSYSACVMTVHTNSIGLDCDGKELISVKVESSEKIGFGLAKTSGIITHFRSLGFETRACSGRGYNGPHSCIFAKPLHQKSQSDN